MQNYDALKSEEEGLSVIWNDMFQVFFILSNAFLLWACAYKWKL